VLGGACLAQESSAAKPQPKEPAIYKFDFTVYEVQGGKKSNVRNYSMMLKEHRTGSIRVGNRVPIATSKEGGFQYIDIGLKLDCTFEEGGGGIALLTDFDLASIIAAEQGDVRSAAPFPNPVIRQLKQYSESLVAPGKTTLIASIDDTNTPRTVQVEVTATKLK
jgi:hypothetical protein